MYVNCLGGLFRTATATMAPSLYGGPCRSMTNPYTTLPECSQRIVIQPGALGKALTRGDSCAWAGIGRKKNAKIRQAKMVVARASRTVACAGSFFSVVNGFMVNLL